MMRSTVSILIAIYGLAVVALTVAVWWKLDKPCPCRRTFEQVREGMTLAEVEAIVGVPTGYYCSENNFLHSVRPPRGFCHQGWLSDDAELWVNFGNDDHASNVIVRDSNTVFLRNRWERVWDWALTGYDIILSSSRPFEIDPLMGRYNLDTFVQIFHD